MVNQIHHDFHHHVLFLRSALGNHQRQGYEGVGGPSLLYAQRLGKINVLACHLFAINAYI